MKRSRTFAIVAICAVTAIAGLGGLLATPGTGPRPSLTDSERATQSKPTPEELRMLWRRELELRSKPDTPRRKQLREEFDASHM